MLKNKKLIITTTIFTFCLCISSMASSYVFSKSTSISVDGSVDIKNRTFGPTDIVLTAGYSDASCTVKDLSGNSISDDDIKSFFVENEDVTDKYGNHFAQLKRYYVSMSQASSGVMTYKLSTTLKDSSYFVCPYFYDKDGNEIEYAYYGKYKASVSNSKLCSVSGVVPATTDYNINDFRTYARANGNQYHITDWCAVFTVQIMCMCVGKTTQMNNLISTFRYYSDKTGGGKQILGIEDIVGNGYEDVDGVVFRSGSTLAASTVSWATKISDYAANITTNQTTLTGATGSNGGYITQMFYSYKKPALSIFPKKLDGTSSTYYCDRLTFDKSSSPNLVVWGSYGPDPTGGLFSLSCNCTYTLANYMFSTRLHAKKLEL